MNTGQIKIRNTKIINDFLDKNDIEFTIQDFLDNFTSIYVDFNQLYKRIRFLGTHVNKKKVQIFIIPAKKVIKLNHIEQLDLLNSIIFIKDLILQLKTIDNLENQESKISKIKII